jgi:hypothetical protein
VRPEYRKATGIVVAQSPPASAVAGTPSAWVLALEHGTDEGGQVVKFKRHSLLLVATVALLAGCGQSSSITDVPDDTPPTLDTTAPPAPTGFAASGTRALKWDASAAPDVARYEVFKFSPDPSRTNAYEMVDITSASTQRSSIVDGHAGVTQYFRVRAVDQSGNASPMTGAVAVEGSPGPDPTGNPDEPPPPRKDEY